ncbi:hypothetical protein [Streptacidiphilus sp. PAMC 29251]
MVLTAYHVACFGRSEEGIVVRTLDGGVLVDAAVVWADASLDAVLLWCDPDLVGPDLSPVRWGRMVCDTAWARPVCTVTGFPRAMLMSDPEYEGMQDPKSVDGRIKPSSELRSGLYSLEVGDASPGGVEGWAGISGAAVFCGPMVIGFAVIAAAGWNGGMLRVVPAYRLLAEPDFAEAVREYSGLPAQVRPADLDTLLVDEPDPRLSCSYLLDPQAQVVPYQEEGGALDQLEDWCLGPAPVDLAVVTGSGGTGKNRLATELARHLAGKGDYDGLPWVAGFLAAKPRRTRPGQRILGDCSHPLLLVVDYAEARAEQLEGLLDVLAAPRQGAKVRVLLLARGNARKWEELIAKWWDRVGTATHLPGFGPSVHLEAEDALPDGQVVAAAQARDAFTDRLHLLADLGLGQLPNDPPAAPGRHYSPETVGGTTTVMAVHVAALAQVLVEHYPDLARLDDPVKVLVRREEVYWEMVADTHLSEDEFDIELIRAMVAAQSLAGATSRGEARCVVDTCIRAHYEGTDAPLPSAAQRKRWEQALAELYPPLDGARWGDIGPMILSREVVAAADLDNDMLLPSLLVEPDLAPRQRERTLLFVAAAGESHPALVERTASVVLADPALLALATGQVNAALDDDRAVRFLGQLEKAAGALTDLPAEAHRVLGHALRARVAARAADGLRERPHRTPAAAVVPAQPTDAPSQVPVQGWQDSLLDLVTRIRVAAVTLVSAAVAAAAPLWGEESRQRLRDFLLRAQTVAVHVRTEGARALRRAQQRWTQWRLRRRSRVRPPKTARGRHR